MSKSGLILDFLSTDSGGVGMQSYQYKTQIFTLFLIVSMLVGCQAFNTRTDKNFYPYELNQAEYQSLNYNKTVFVAPIQLMIEPDPEAEKFHNTVNTSIKSYLVQHGYQVLPSEQVTTSWNRNKQEIGGLYDQKTGRISSKRIKHCLGKTLTDLQQDIDFSAIIVPQLSYHLISLDKKSLEWGVWNGVKRAIVNQGSGKNGWSSHWALSLNIAVYSQNNKPVFMSRGGIDFFTKTVHTPSTQEIKRKSFEEILPQHIIEAVEIGFYPFIDSPIILSTLPDSYLKMVRRKIFRYMKYPEAALSLKPEGKVTVRFNIPFAYKNTPFRVRQFL